MRYRRRPAASQRQSVYGGGRRGTRRVLVLLQGRRSRWRADSSLDRGWRSTCSRRRSGHAYHSRGRRRRRIILGRYDIGCNSIVANGLIRQLVLGGVHQGCHYRVCRHWGGRSHSFRQRNFHYRWLGRGHRLRGRKYRGRGRWWMDLKSG